MAIASLELFHDAGVLDASIDVGLEAIALASFVDGLAVQVLFLNKTETKRAKAELVQRYLKRSFGRQAQRLATERRV